MNIFLKENVGPRYQKCGSTFRRVPVFIFPTRDTPNTKASVCRKIFRNRAIVAIFLREKPRSVKPPALFLPTLARFFPTCFFLFPLGASPSSFPSSLLKQTCLEYPPKTLVENFLCVKLKEAWYAYDKIMRTESIRCIKSHCINLCDPRRSCVFIFFLSVANACHIHFWFIPLFYSV